MGYDAVPVEPMQQADDPGNVHDQGNGEEHGLQPPRDGDGDVAEASVEHHEDLDNTLPAALQPYSTQVPPEDTDPSTWDSTAIQYATDAGLPQLVIPVAPS